MKYTSSDVMLNCGIAYYMGGLLDVQRCATMMFFQCDEKGQEMCNNLRSKPLVILTAIQLLTDEV